MDRGLEALVPAGVRVRAGAAEAAPGPVASSSPDGSIQYLPIAFTILATGFIFFATLGLRRLT